MTRNRTFPTFEVISNESIAMQMFRLVLQAKGEFGPFLPGQFLHVKVTDSIEHVLRRPISLCEYLPQENQLVLVYRASGAGTRILSRKKPGDPIDIIGPLGNGFPLAAGTTHGGEASDGREASHGRETSDSGRSPLDGDNGACLLLAGGIGVPPMVELAKQLSASGKKITAIIGFQTSEQVILASDLEQYGEVRIVTNDGSMGSKGFVTDELNDNTIQAHSIYYACGPTPMLRAVQAKLRGRMPGYLSLEERMGCGIGLCAACVHPVSSEGSNGTKCVDFAKVCRKGPVFPESEVLFQ